ncbi:MAG: class I SAM-dependent methyltransferase [Methyloligellaceae bacterium]
MTKKSAIDASDVKNAYRRWAPVYDFTFGKIADAGRLHTVKIINRRKGSLLEVGVGTGLSLPKYGDHLQITGIDLSAEMLDKARVRQSKKGLTNIDGLYEMDAGALEFPDDTFDTVVAMYVLTVVPNPERVMRELERVCAPGGEVILVNHFSQDEGARGWIERKMAPLAATLGWRPVFEQDRVTGCKGLQLIERSSLKPFGLFTMLRFLKQPTIAADSKLERDLTAGNRAASLNTAEAGEARL